VFIAVTVLHGGRTSLSQLDDHLICNAPTSKNTRIRADGLADVNIRRGFFRLWVATVKAKASAFYKTYSETRAGEMSSARSNFRGAALLIATIAPLVLLGLVFVVAWILAGFVRGADP
jgi:hypothetical protein